MPYGPFGATLRSFRLMLADGTVLTCSRTENAECSPRDRRLRAVRHRDRRRARDRRQCAARAAPRGHAGGAVRPALHRGGARGGRAHGLRAAVGRARRIFSARPRSVRFGRPRTALSLAAAARPGPSITVATVFRAQTGSENAKKRRWYLETVLGPRVTARKLVTRNAILNFPVALLADSTGAHRYPA